MKCNYASITQFQQLVELKDYRPPTKKEYVRYVCKLAEHFQCDPATLSENQIREYFLFLRQHKHYKHSPMKAAKYSLLAFYLDCVKVQGWTVFKDVRIAEPEVLPIVLARAEVAALLGAVTEPRFRTCLRLMFHCENGSVPHFYTFRLGLGLASTNGRCFTPARRPGGTDGRPSLCRARSALGSRRDAPARCAG
jgi:hypothetical protein